MVFIVLHERDDIELKENDEFLGDIGDQGDLMAQIEAASNAGDSGVHAFEEGKDEFWPEETDFMFGDDDDDGDLDFDEFGVDNRTDLRVDPGRYATGKGKEYKDLHAAIKAAGKMASSGGGIVLLPVGKIAVDGSLSVPSNVTIRGAGNGETTLIGRDKKGIFSLKGTRIKLQRINFRVPQDKVLVFVDPEAKKCEVRHCAFEGNKRYTLNLAAMDKPTLPTVTVAGECAFADCTFESSHLLCEKGGKANLIHTIFRHHGSKLLDGKLAAIDSSGEVTSVGLSIEDYPVGLFIKEGSANLTDSLVRAVYVGIRSKGESILSIKGSRVEKSGGQTNNDDQSPMAIRNSKSNKTRTLGLVSWGRGTSCFVANCTFEHWQYGISASDRCNIHVQGCNFINMLWHCMSVQGNQTTVVLENSRVTRAPSNTEDTKKCYGFISEKGGQGTITGCVFENAGLMCDGIRTKLTCSKTKIFTYHTGFLAAGESILESHQNTITDVDRALILNQGTAVVSDSTFTDIHSYGAYAVNGSDLTIQKCSIQFSNGAKIALLANKETTVRVNGCMFQNVQKGIVVKEGSIATVTQSRFHVHEQGFNVGNPNSRMDCLETIFDATDGPEDTVVLQVDSDARVSLKKVKVYGREVGIVSKTKKGKETRLEAIRALFEATEQFRIEYNTTSTVFAFNGCVFNSKSDDMPWEFSGPNPSRSIVMKNSILTRGSIPPSFLNTVRATPTNIYFGEMSSMEDIAERMVSRIREAKECSELEERELMLDVSRDSIKDIDQVLEYVSLRLAQEPALAFLATTVQPPVVPLKVFMSHINEAIERDGFNADYHSIIAEMYHRSISSAALVSKGIAGSLGLLMDEGQDLYAENVENYRDAMTKFPQPRDPSFVPSIMQLGESHPMAAFDAYIYFESQLSDAIREDIARTIGAAPDNNYAYLKQNWAAQWIFHKNPRAIANLTKGVIPTGDHNLSIRSLYFDLLLDQKKHAMVTKYFSSHAADEPLDRIYCYEADLMSKRSNPRGFASKREFVNMIGAFTRAELPLPGYLRRLCASHKLPRDIHEILEPLSDLNDYHRNEIAPLVLHDCIAPDNLTPQQRVPGATCLICWDEDLAPMEQVIYGNDVQGAEHVTCRKCTYDQFTRSMTALCDQCPADHAKGAVIANRSDMVMAGLPKDRILNLVRLRVSDYLSNKIKDWEPCTAPDCIGGAIVTGKKPYFKCRLCGFLNSNQGHDIDPWMATMLLNGFSAQTTRRGQGTHRECYHCGAPFVKGDQCSHMTCAQCHQRFDLVYGEDHGTRYDDNGIGDQAYVPKKPGILWTIGLYDGFKLGQKLTPSDIREIKKRIQRLLPNFEVEGETFVNYGY